MESCKCHSKSIARRSNELRGCYHPRHSSTGNPKIRCLGKHAPGCPRRKFDKEEDEAGKKLNGETLKMTSCYDKFALAKRLHAANLEHQPLPDRVDDRVFNNTGIAHQYHLRSSSCEARRQASPSTEEKRFRPALGYKEPKTRMDLAICWETPIDPVYEPRRPKHIDGSEGGTAPAIFALIQHMPMPSNHELLTHKKEKDNEDKHGKAERKMRRSRDDRCCCDCLCDIESIELAEERGIEFRHSDKSRSNSVPSPSRITERRCTACKLMRKNAEERTRDPRLIKSAVGVALGLEKKSDGIHKKGSSSSPTGIAVPRPRTPFARRSFRIDTLAPPFSIIDRHRDTDYPEHLRLVSVYQHSYRNPQGRSIHRF